MRPLFEAAHSASDLGPPQVVAAMGCRVEASFRACGSGVVREQRVWEGPALAAESVITFAS